jgi:hypothetical protein
LLYSSPSTNNITCQLSSSSTKRKFHERTLDLNCIVEVVTDFSIAGIGVHCTQISYWRSELLRVRRNPSELGIWADGPWGCFLAVQSMVPIQHRTKIGHLLSCVQAHIGYAGPHASIQCFFSLADYHGQVGTRNGELWLENQDTITGAKCFSSTGWLLSQPTTLIALPY